MEGTVFLVRQRVGRSSLVLNVLAEKWFWLCPSNAESETQIPHQIKYCKEEQAFTLPVKNSSCSAWHSLALDSMDKGRFWRHLGSRPYRFLTGQTFSRSGCKRLYSTTFDSRSPLRDTSAFEHGHRTISCYPPTLPLIDGTPDSVRQTTGRFRRLWA